jgi:tRNA/tmRNA/rRNA uracil-C5-methylase (TrmA/RlmC/RlmD family)
MFLLFESSCNRTRSKDRHTGEYGGCLIQIFPLDVTRRFKHQLVLQIIISLLPNSFLWKVVVAAQARAYPLMLRFSMVARSG